MEPKFEIEKKFILTAEKEKKLIEGAEFVGEKKFTDTYYDDARYSLTTKDIWLRSRDDRFELKVPMNVSIDERTSDQYQELETDKEIAAYLKLPTDIPLVDVLRNASYVPFVSIVTTRRKYKKDGYNIDLDATDFGYSVAEIEYMTDKESKIQEATQKIIEYAKSHGLSANDVVHGKVVEYLKRIKPAHFQALLDAGVVKQE